MGVFRQSDGARYYDPQISMWYGVDPMADKYPSMSAFMYTAGNPVMLRDPDGKDWYQDEEGNYTYDKNVTKDTKLAEGQKYLGETYNINVKNGDEKSQINLNKNGSVVDQNGKYHWGDYDPNFKSGHKIKGAKDNDDIFIKGSYNNSLSNLAEKIRTWDRDLSGEYKTGEDAQAPAFIKLLNSFNPILALTDAGYKIFTGTDMYGVEVSSANRYIGSTVSVLFMIPGVGATVKIGDEMLFILGPVINEATK